MKDTLFKILGEVIGVEAEDIHPEDSLRDELHMNSVDLAELADKLNNEGVGPVDLSEIDTVEELLDQIGADEEM